MKMVKVLFLAGLAGVAGAAYFFDARKGGKRRRNVRKQLEQGAHVTNGVVQDCSRQARTIASNFMKKGNSEWVPSPKFAGALGSMLAVYSSGRRGPVGTILRILSLGLFARALMTSNSVNSNIKERPETQRVRPPSTVYAESLVSG